MAVDVALLVALEEEFDVLADGLRDCWSPRPNATTGGYDYWWTEPTDYTCVATLLEQMGTLEAALGATRLLEFSPALLVNVGIAAGIHNDIKVGDVVVPQQVVAYDKTGKAVQSEHDSGDWEWEVRPDTARTDHGLVQEVRHFAHANLGKYTEWQDAGARRFSAVEREYPGVVASLLSRGILRRRPRLHVVPMASGNFVIAARGFAQWVRGANGSLKAAEMEAAGLTLAAAQRVEPVPTLVVRGISDHIEAAKNETDAVGEGRFRRIAMENAWDLFRALIDLGLLPRSVSADDGRAEWPHRRPTDSPHRPVSRTNSGRPAPPWINRGLDECLAELYPDYPSARAVWQRAGGRPGQVEAIPRPNDLWQRLLQLSYAGATARPLDLLTAVLAEYPNNELVASVVAELRMAEES